MLRWLLATLLLPAAFVVGPLVRCEPSPSPVVEVVLDADVAPQAGAPLDSMKRLTVTAAANTRVLFSSTVRHIFARCANLSSGVNLFIVNAADADTTTSGKGPYCDSCTLGPELPPLGDAYLRTSAGSATVACDFVESWPSGASLGPPPGMSIGAADARYVNVTGDTMTGALLGANGTAAAPEWSFSGDTDTGVFSVGANDLGFSAGGVQRADISTTAVTSTLPLLGAAGTALAPEFSFSGDADTGVFNVGANDLGFSAGGVQRADISTTAFTSTLAYVGPTGSANAPAFTFTGDGDTGVFNVGANRLGMTASGLLNLEVSSTYVLPSVHVVSGAAGTALSPDFSFFGDQDTGVFNVGANDLGFSAGGVQRADISTTAVTSTLPLLAPAGTALAPSHTFSGDADTGIYSSAANTIGFTANGAKVIDVAFSGINPAADNTQSVGGGLGLAFANVYTYFLTNGQDATGGVAVNNLDISPNTTNVESLGTDTKAFKQLRVAAGTAAVPSIRMGDSDSGVVGGANTVSVSVGGAAEVTIDTTGMTGTQSTSGTMHSWRVPTGIAATIPTKPACSTSSDAGRIIYVDDSNDAAVAMLCVCRAGADDVTYSWVQVADNATACIS